MKINKKRVMSSNKHHMPSHQIVETANGVNPPGHYRIVSNPVNYQ